MGSTRFEVLFREFSVGFIEASAEVMMKESQPCCRVFGVLKVAQDGLLKSVREAALEAICDGILNTVIEGVLEAAQDGALEVAREGVLNAVGKTAVESQSEETVAAVDEAFVRNAEGDAMGADTSDAVAVLDLGTDAEGSARVFMEIDEAGNERAVSNSGAAD